MRSISVQILWVFVVSIITVTSLWSQCSQVITPQASLICSDAPILCEIECLDNFFDTLPAGPSGIQPEMLCSGGTPNNMSWFAFVAGSDSIALTITPSNCTEVTLTDSLGANQTYEGIQVGIYSTCDFDDPDREFVCATNCSTDPIDIGSSQFEIGKIYYLFVDGCAGSVCEYDVDVEFGDQAFEMPEFTTMTNQYNIDFATDTLCTGATIDFVLDGFDLNVDYAWTISPPTDTYPTGVHPVTDTSAVTWQFTEPGNFEICAVASNPCDSNVPLCVQITVDTLVDEYFTDLSICQECFGTVVLTMSDTTCIIGELGTLFPTILTEDPNNDGIPGWQGFDVVMTPGILENVVAAQYGCSYSQFVDIDAIPISPRENVTLYRCATDFPFDYHGTIINNPVENQFITIDNAASTRCDSLVSLTVELFGQTSNIVQGDCVQGGVVLHYNLNADIPPGATLTYEWQMGATTVMDTDGIDTTFIAEASGFYSCTVTLDINGVICNFTRGSNFIDLDDLSPDAPSFGLFPMEVCETEPAVIFVENNGTSDTYEWSTIPLLPFVEGLTSDTIYVDANGNNGFQYSVRAVNECGESTTISEVMAVSSMPDLGIDGLDRICLDSVMTVEYSGASNVNGAVFTWNTGDAEVLNPADLDGPGPIMIRYATAGNKQISYTITNGACTTMPAVHILEALSVQSPPMVNCEEQLQAVEFNIVDLPAGMTYTYEVLGGIFTDDETIGNTITFSGMPSSETLNLEFTFTTECGSITNSVWCTSLDCPVVDIELAVEAPDGYCSNGTNNLDISVTALVNSLPATSGIFSGDHISADGVFDSAIAGIGSHTVFFQVTELGCDFTDSITVEILEQPTLSSTIVADNCDPSLASTVTLSSNSSGIFGLGGTATTTDGVFENFEAGSYAASITADNGCAEEILVEVPLGVSPFIQLLGDSVILEGSLSQYSVETNIENIVQYIWMINGTDTICQAGDCSVVDFMPAENDELCLTVLYNIDCEITTCKQISTYQETKVHMPNAFSPNNDKNNDTFYPISNVANLPVEKMLIFDRWGNCVFHEENLPMGEQGAYWDGTYQGNAVSQGVYIYTVQYRDHQENIITITGDVTVFK